MDCCLQMVRRLILHVWVGREFGSRISGFQLSEALSSSAWSHNTFFVYFTLNHHISVLSLSVR
jgi:hypothetical protein